MSPEHPDPDMVGYRPLSGWAMGALGVGLAAPLAFTNWFFWCVPVAGVVTAAVALGKIRRAETPLLGRKAALFGLALSLVCGAAAPARYFARNMWLAARAERLADLWFQRLREGQPQQARDLMLHITPKHPPRNFPNSDLAEAKSDLELFKERNPVDKLLALGDRASAEHLVSAVSSDDARRDAVTVVYVIHFPGEDKTKPLYVSMNVFRQIESDGVERWIISSVSAATDRTAFLAPGDDRGYCQERPREKVCSGETASGWLRADFSPVCTTERNL